MVVIIWGVNFVVIKLGVLEVPPLFLTALRFAFAALPAVFFLPRPQLAWRLLIAYGLVLGVIKFGLLFVALRIGMSASLASILLQMQAFFTIVLSAVLLREKPLPVQIAGGCVALVGLGVIASGMDASSGGIWPFLMTIGAALCWGIANLIMKQAGRVDMLSFMVWTSLVSPLPLLALSLVFGEGPAIASLPQRMTWVTPFTVFYLAYPTTLFGFAIWGRLLMRYPAPLVAPFSLLVPIFGMSSGILILSEHVLPSMMIGGLLIVAGLALNILGPVLIKSRGEATKTLS